MQLLKIFIVCGFFFFIIISFIIMIFLDFFFFRFWLTPNVKAAKKNPKKPKLSAG